MHAITSLALALGLLLVPGDRGDPDWDRAWDDLDRLEALASDTTEAQDLRAALARLAEEEAASPRGQLLARHLSRLRGEAPTAWPAVPGEGPVFTGREGWLAAEVMPPGPARVRVVLRSMGELEAGRQRRFLMTAWDTATAEARALRLADGALPIQERLHAEFQAPWSALNLSLTRMWLGDHAGAEAVLGEAIAAERSAGRPAADLCSQRGISALAAGDDRRALDYLGRALAAGSTNAAVVLARRDLDAGRRRAARIGFRALLWDPDPGAWALRGWGLSLLPGPPSGPITSDRSIDSTGR